MTQKRPGERIADAFVVASTFLVGFSCFLPWYGYSVGTTSLSQQTSLCSSGPAPVCPGIALPATTSLNAFGNDTLTWRLSILAVSLIIVGLVIGGALAPVALSRLRTSLLSFAFVVINAVLVVTAFTAVPANPLAGLPRSESWSYGAYTAIAAALVAGAAAVYGLATPYRPGRQASRIVPTQPSRIR